MAKEKNRSGEETNGEMPNFQEQVPTAKGGTDVKEVWFAVRS